MERRMSIADCGLRIDCGLVADQPRRGLHVVNPQSESAIRNSSNTVAIPDFLGSGPVTMAEACSGRGGGCLPQVRNDLRELRVGDGLLLIGQCHHPAI